MALQVHRDVALVGHMSEVPDCATAILGCSLKSKKAPTEPQIPPKGPTSYLHSRMSGLYKVPIE